MLADVARVLLSRETIRQRVAALAAEIVAAYAGRSDRLTFVPILSGSIVFLADLIREMPVHMRLALIHLSTYRGTQAGQPRVVADISHDVRGRDVIIVDDILDTGRTLTFVRDMLAERGPASVRICVLLRKPGKAPPSLHADFVGFDIEDEFVVGYGLDYNDLYRNLPYIGVLRPECIAAADVAPG
ncbi:MAG: hypoxanthine phosphoribosyltransferase [Phycisphaerales bacterium]|nr:hypoxanthine phosphoribosyltransferase [Phycisphaerales bacterium]